MAAGSLGRSLGVAGQINPDYRSLYAMAAATPMPAPVLVQGPPLETSAPPAAARNFAIQNYLPQRFQEGGVVKPEIPAPFEGSVREAPFPGAVREGRWREETPSHPPPKGAAPAQIISPADIARHESEAGAAPDIKPEEVAEEATRRILTHHSMTLDPNDRRVTLRVNPDTGSIRTTGGYFVPGDLAQERLLEHTSDYDRDKIPAVSAAIARGDPFSFLYRSAEEEEPETEETAGQRPTAESRAYEQAVSTAEQRAESKEGQLQRVTMIPQQWAITKPSVEKPRRVMLEGFANDAALNNSQHTFDAAKQAGVPVPYQDTGFKFQKDLAGYLMNQQHGYLGDGTGPRLEASNAPSKAYLAEQAKPPGERYIPHLLQPEEAQFMNTVMNIVPSGTTRPEGKRPTFSENVKWLSRVNQGNIGREAGPNVIRDSLDRMMPPVPIRSKPHRGKKMSDEEWDEYRRNFVPKITRHVPWSKGTLESTYRAYRLDLLEHDPELLAQSLRARTGTPHEPHIIMKAPVAVHTAGEYKPAQGYAQGGLVQPAPISSDPEVGMPLAGPKAAGFLKAKKQGKTFQTPIHTKGERFEISDKDMKFKMDPTLKDPSRPQTVLERYGMPPGGVNLNAAIDHPELFKNYPHLKWVGVTVDRRLPHAGYYAAPSEDNYEHIVIGDPNDKETLAHEIQHAVQYHEGFPKGADPDSIYKQLRADYGIKSNLKKEFDDLRQKGQFIIPRSSYGQSEEQHYDDWMTERLRKMAEARYHMTPGEMEANVAGDRSTGMSYRPMFGGLARRGGALGTPVEDIEAAEQQALRHGYKAGIVSKWNPPAQGASPISDNPEMGAPVGEGQEEPSNIIHIIPPRRYEEPTLLPKHPEARRLTAPIIWKKPEEPELKFQEGGEVPEQEPPPLPDRENNAMTFEAVSPSIRTDQTYRGAKGAFNRPAHKEFRDFSDRLEDSLARAKGYNKASSADTIGDWSDGAENTIANESEGQDYEDRKVAAALKAHHSAQKQALLFRHHDEGAPPHSLYRLKFNTDKDEDVRKLLDDAGIGMRTLYPSKGKGQPVEVHVADLSPEGEHWNAIEKLIKSGHITDAWHHKGTGELIGTEDENRYNATTEYKRILEEARGRWREARAGGLENQGNQPGGDQAPEEPWFEPFAREAEANFQKLRASDEYKKQARALSLRSADADRKNITLERQRMLEQNKQKAQNWVNDNPETNELAAHHFLDKHEEFPDNVKKNEHVGEFFNARNEKLDYGNPEHRKLAADALTHDIMHSLSRDSSAIGWYSETVRKAFDKFAEIAPELKTDKASNLAFRLALAITSQGQNVFDNADSAWKAYQYWKQHGEFPTENAKETFGGGIKAPQMEFNFAKANRLWNKDHKGDAEAFENFLGQTIKHSKLQKDYKKTIGSTLADEDIPMSALFGPKIGIFYQNLSGNEEPLTMDVWFSRTLNRLAGDMFGFSPDAMTKDRGKDKAHLTTLRNLLDTGQITGVGEKDQAKMRKEMDRLLSAKNLDRDRAMKLAPTIRDWAEKQHNHFAETIGQEGVDRRGYHPDRKTAENQNAKNIDENFKQLQADPRNGTERRNWTHVLDQVRENMQKAGINITNADRQALLWYLEQRLFQGVTGSKETSNDYLDAAHDLVRKVKEGSI